VLNGPCYIVSDLHLGAAPPDVERRFLAFLRSLPRTAGSLVINGDLFDFWFEWRSVLPRRGFRVLAALADLVEAGVPVLWIAGNHDCWGGEIIREDAGVDYHVGPWEGRIAGWRARIEHGDGLRPVEDRRYRALRAVLRNRVAIGAMRLLHPDVGSWLASGSSEASRTHRARDGGAGLKAVAMAQLGRAAGPELLVFGHSHVATLERGPHRSVYANAGSWLDDSTYLRVTTGKIELRRWGVSAERECLHTLDRGSEEALA
jgi:UDP-2,3-diacylglucosamine hydrolase